MGKKYFYPIRFRGLVLFFLFIFPGLTNPSVVGAEALLSQILAELQNRYEKTSDFTARFIQDGYIKTLNKTEREEGTVYFKNPKRMRWEYTKPKGKLLVINPEKTWLYLPEDKLVYIQDTDRMFQSRLAVKFLTGVGRLTDDFEVAHHSPEKTDREGHHLLVLTPKISAEGVERLILTVDKTSFLIRQVSFNDFAGNTTRIEFRNVALNTKPAERLFTFRVPAGVEVMYLP